MAPGRARSDGPGEEAMPTVTPEKLHESAQALRKRLAEGAETMEGPKLRALKKRLRRLQRKRRRILSARARSAAKPEPESK
jgi:hypothetical protein